MKTKIYLRLKWLLLCCFLLLSVNMMAGGTDYWYKVTATASPTGEGKVYVSGTQTTPKSSDYGDEKIFTTSENSSQKAATKEFYLFAQHMRTTIKGEEYRHKGYSVGFNQLPTYEFVKV